MTTIAFDGKTLAADKQCSQGGRKIKVKSKLRRLKNGALAGGCGDPVMCSQFFDWLDGVDDLPDWLEREGGAELVDQMEVLVAFPDGRMFLYNGVGHPVELDEKVYSIGSGSDYALAAMENGKTAADAVMYAHTRDSGTGMGVESIEFEARRRKRKSP